MATQAPPSVREERLALYDHWHDDGRPRRTYREGRRLLIEYTNQLLELEIAGGTEVDIP